MKSTKNSTRTSARSATGGQYRQPLTVGTVKKETGFKTSQPSNLKISTYFKREGYPALSKALIKVERHLAK